MATTSGRGWAAAAFLAILAGCGPAAGGPGAGLDPGPDLGRTVDAEASPARPTSLFEHQVEWRGPLAFDEDGLTPRLELDTEAHPAISLWVVLEADCGGRCCVQLTDVDAGGEQLVPLADTRDEQARVCRGCRSRVRVAAGDGFFTLPNDGEPLPGDRVGLRLQARDCGTYLPLEPRFGEPLPGRAWVGLIRHPDPPEAPQLDLQVYVADDALDGDPALALAEAGAVVEHCFSAAGLRVRTMLHRLGDRGHLSYRSDDLGPLEAAVPGARGAVSVAWVSCLEHTDAVTGERSHPAGFSPRIPGGVPYDGVWIATRPCAGTGSGPARPAAELGRMMAHELGHYFGLYHTVELDLSTDHLADTSTGGFMAAIPSTTAGCALSPSQASVVRQHLSLGR